MQGRTLAAHHALSHVAVGWMGGALPQYSLVPASESWLAGVEPSLG